MGRQSKLKAFARDRKNSRRPAPLVAQRPAMEEVPQIHSSDGSPIESPTRRVAGGGDRVEEKSAPGGAEAATSAEEVRQLRTLNDILAKRMMESRQQKNQDVCLLSDLEDGAVRAALSSQFSDEVRRLVIIAEERGRAAGAAEARKEAVGEKEINIAETDKKNAAMEEKIALLKKDLHSLAREKTQVEERLLKDQAAMESKSREAAKKNAAMIDEIALLQRDLKNLASEKKDAEKENEKMDEEINLLKRGLKSLASEKADAEESLQNARAEIGALQRGLASMNEELKRQHLVNSRWKCVSSAMAAVTALVSIAFAAAKSR